MARPTIGHDDGTAHDHAEHDHAGHDHRGGPHTPHHPAGHDHSDPLHSHAAGADERRVAWAFVIIVAFLALQVVGGVISGSLALLADAGHMVSDAVALGMSWAALRIGRRPADPLRSYGYRRLEVLVAFANGCALFVVSAWIAFEALSRLVQPRVVHGAPMLAVAIAGLLANAVAFLVLSGGRRDNLNMRSAWLHVLGDLLGFAITVVAAAVILLTGWSRVDPILSLIVSALIVRSAVQIVRASGHILLEGTPAGLDVAQVREDLLAALPSVCDVHHVHCWSLTQEEQFITLHVRTNPGADLDALVPAINRRLEARFGITHTTIQVDHTECADEHHA
ncbi:MAG TPA: cation diffusion facilitator family transporter [Steroidobacteraceae bacterium]|nr:cation diffusion facilitator family transporter [Steroidobacteraceae bacterium]